VKFTANREAVVKLEVRGPTGTKIEVEFVLDTGFTEYLTLPPNLISALSLPLRLASPMYLADGTRVMVQVYDAVVLWDGRERLVGIHSTPGGALLGMSLLYGSRLLLDVVDGGPVTITPLP
jgi:clan AA aspartic protease